LNLLTVPVDFRAESVTCTGAGELRILWPDAHETRFDSGWLRAHAYHEPAETSATRPRLWGAEIAGDLPVLDAGAVVAQDQALFEWCSHLKSHGFALLRGLPPSSGEVCRLGRRIGYVSEFYFGGYFDVVDRSEPESTAYTSLALPPHTDLPSRVDPPGYELLHCLTNSVEGGESILVDGFRVAASLADERPDDYELLSTTAVEFRFVSADVDYRYRGSIIEHDDAGEIRSIRFNSFLQAPFNVPFEKMGQLYRAFYRFLEMTQEERFQVRLRLTPGDVLSFDNWRLLHARTGFDPGSGTRHLQGCYIDRDELDCRLRVLSRRSPRRPDRVGR